MQGMCGYSLQTTVHPACLLHGHLRTTTSQTFSTRTGDARLLLARDWSRGVELSYNAPTSAYEWVGCQWRYGTTTVCMLHRGGVVCRVRRSSWWGYVSGKRFTVLGGVRKSARIIEECMVPRFPDPPGTQWPVRGRSYPMRWGREYSPLSCTCDVCISAVSTHDICC